MHEEAQRLAVLNKKLKSELKLHVNKLASTQEELNKLKQENQKLVSKCKATTCHDTSTSFNMDDYKFLQTKFESFKKDHHVECMKLHTELSYLKDLFGKLNKGKSDLNHMLSMQKHTTDKTDLGYNKQTSFTKKTHFVSSKGVNPTKVTKRKNMVYSRRSAKTCHYCIKKGHTSYYFYVRKFDILSGKCIWIPKDLLAKINPIGPNLN